MSLDSINIRLSNAENNIINSINKNNRLLGEIVDDGFTHSTHLEAIQTAVEDIDTKTSTSAKQDEVISELKDIEANQTNGNHKVLCFGNTNPADPASGVNEAIHTDGNGNVNCQVINTLSVNGYRRVIGDGSTNSHALVNAEGYQYNKIIGVDFTGTDHEIATDTGGNLLVNEKTVYSNTDIGNANNLKTYADSTDAIDMVGQTHLVISVVCSGMTGSLGKLQNIKMYYSLDNTNYVLGEVIDMNEVPNIAGTYTGFIRLERTGFRYVKLFAVGISGILPGSNYTVKYSRT
tara:strand:+ start:1821 stop:2693 length:873 start_codon:yes stop_codon:yes gene_type:complete